MTPDDLSSDCSSRREKEKEGRANTVNGMKKKKHPATYTLGRVTQADYNKAALKETP